MKEEGGLLIAFHASWGGGGGGGHLARFCDTKIQCFGCYGRHHLAVCNTVKPLLGGPPIKRTPSVKRTLSRVTKLTSHISHYNEPLFRGHLY